MAKAKQLPSGKWMCRGYNRATKKQKAFTANTRTEAERLARMYADNQRDVAEHPLDHTTLRQAAADFVQSRTAVLSPSTLYEYNRIVKNDMDGTGMLADLADMPITQITAPDLQQAVNEMAASLSPKTARNRYGLVIAVLHATLPDRTYKVDLPRKRKSRIVMPSEAEIRRLLDAAAGTDMEVPVLLALFGPMRRGEICALDADHVDGNVVHVEYALARTVDHTWIRTSPKTYAGDRFITYPDFVIKKLPASGPVTQLHPGQITHRYPELMRRAGLSYTFHQLRHWSVSDLHRMGLSDQEILDRAGWESTEIFKEVYRHGLNEKDRAVEAFERFGNG